MDKAALIARKHEVIAQMARLRRQLGREDAALSPRAQRRHQQMQRQLEALMAEEYRLRLQIDRSR